MGPEQAPERAGLLRLLEESGDVDVWRVGKRDLDVRVSKRDAERLQDAIGGACAVLIPDVDALLAAADPGALHAGFLNRLEGLSETKQRVMGGVRTLQHDHDSYLEYPDMVELLQTWEKEHSGVAKFIPSIAPIPTWENRNVSCISITSSTVAPHKKVLFTSGLHAREWIGPATVLYIIDKFLEAYKEGKGHGHHQGKKNESTTSGDIVDLLDNERLQIVVCPCINPDGYTYTHHRQRLWRKNRRENGLGSFGVDLNRNFPIHWGETGSSSLPFSEIYQ